MDTYNKLTQFRQTNSGDSRLHSAQNQTTEDDTEIYLDTRLKCGGRLTLFGKVGKEGERPFLDCRWWPSKPSIRFCGCPRSFLPSSRPRQTERGKTEQRRLKFSEGHIWANVTPSIDDSPLTKPQRPFELQLIAKIVPATRVDKDGREWDNNPSSQEDEIRIRARFECDRGIRRFWKAKSICFWWRFDT